jgi:(E)-4-hydroxy-3-methyl-but-2-enyl pyrophosphate reductase
VVIYGDAQHPEVRGVVDWVKGEATVVADADEPVEIPRRRVALMSQTTKSHEAFAGFVQRFLARNLDRISEARVINTTCMETEVRYEAARNLAAEVDLMVVIGGRDSANTAKLAAVCRSAGVEVRQIEREGEIEPAWLEGVQRVGVTAGASTPDVSINRVVERLREIDTARNQG